MKTIPKYEDILDLDKLKEVYHEIKLSSKHKEKFIRFELFSIGNFISILMKLKSQNYHHGKYNIFLISDPKYRVIMSENLEDKIINHLISKNFLFPVLEPKLISSNIATRKNKGTKAGIYYMKKYINKLKQNHDQFYVLKCDIYKYFYSIDHTLLLQKLAKEFDNEKILKLLTEIIKSTDQNYITQSIQTQISDEYLKILNSHQSLKEKKNKITSLNKIPVHQLGKGLPIGNMSSQILAIYYLNELDHFIKEKLKVKYYIRYMDDFILLSNDKEYLEYCLSQIKKELSKLKLQLNNKTEISEIHHGINFLGYRFILKNKKLIIKLGKNTKKKLIRKLKNTSVTEKEFILRQYNGILKHAHSSGLKYHLKGNNKNKKMNTSTC